MFSISTSAVCFAFREYHFCWIDTRVRTTSKHLVYILIFTYFTPFFTNFRLHLSQTDFKATPGSSASPSKPLKKVRILQKYNSHSIFISTWYLKVWNLMKNFVKDSMISLVGPEIPANHGQYSGKMYRWFKPFCFSIVLQGPSAAIFANKSGILLNHSLDLFYYIRCIVLYW